MDSRQYSWIVRNKYSYRGPAELGASGLDPLLRSAARDAANLARAAQAWQSAADGELLHGAQVEAFKDGCLSVRLSDGMMLHRARQGGAQLQRALRVLLPTLRSVRFLAPTEQRSRAAGWAHHD